MARILIVDDMPAMRQMLRRYLERDGHEVVGELADGGGAAGEVRATSPDIVVMDYEMPQVRGCDATADIRAAFPEVPLIAGFTSCDDEGKRRLLAAGANVVFSKNELDLLLDYLG